MSTQAASLVNSGCAALERVLCVEDEADIRTVVQIALHDLGGMQVHICSSGGDALTAAPRFAPDLILLDVMMPGMDGPATLAALRALPCASATPVVFMTAKAQSHEVARYRQLGALDVIVKPFDPMTLADSLRAIWARAQGAPA